MVAQVANAPNTQNDIRRQMNDIADYMANGNCEDWADYKYQVGIIRGLALAERLLIDEDDRQKGIGEHAESMADEE